MTINWTALANRKYDIMGQQADAGTMSANAQMLQARTAQGLAAPESDSIRATAALRAAQTGQVAPDAAAQRGLMATQGGLNQAMITNTQANTADTLNSPTARQLQAAQALRLGLNVDPNSLVADTPGMGMMDIFGGLQAPQTGAGMGAFGAGGARRLQAPQQQQQQQPAQTSTAQSMTSQLMRGMFPGFGNMNQGMP